jgi:Tol biopolymer transport system component
VAAAALVGVTLLAPGTASATFPGENGKIFFSARELSSGIYDIWSMNPDGSELVNLTDLPGGPGEGTDPSVSGDGTRVAFTVGSQATSEVWIMNADGSNPTRLTFNSDPPPNGLDQMPGISPDGTRIAFMTTRETPPMPTGQEFDIWVMNSDGGGQQALLHGTGESYFPEFTPDGQTVVMAHEVSGDLDIAYVPSTGGPFSSATQVTEASTVVETHPSVSPDGTRVAFARRLTLPNHDILSIGLDAMNEVPIAATGDQELNPAYSPDGAKIVYYSGASDGLVIANVDGSAPTPLNTGTAQSATQPDWAVARTGPPDSAVADTDPPETEITKAPKNRTDKPKAKFGFVSDEPGSSFDCKFDKKGFAPCASPRKYKHLKARKHKFQVRATDPAGNTDSSPDEDKFKVVD